MGQINCQCQHIPTEETVSVKRYPDSLPFLPTESNEPTQIFTKMALTCGQNSIDIPLRNNSRVTFGSTDDCDMRHTGKGQFKAEVWYRNRCVFIRDCGVGLGVFIRKRRAIMKPGSAEILIHVLDQWVSIRVLSCRQIILGVYSAEGKVSHCLQDQSEQQISLSGCVLRLRQDEGAYRIGRADRGEIWVMACDERRVRTKDVVRLGAEVFTVNSISSYLECSTIIRRH